MTKLLGLALVALLAMGLSAQAEPQTPAMAALQRRIEWQDQHIRHLEHRRAYLHRFIQDLRNPTPSSASSTSTSSTPTSSSASSGGWSDELRAVGFPESAISTMLYIINRESGGDPSAVNPSSGACGLTQLYPCPPGGLDPMTNLRLAYQKYRASGFAPWGG